MPLTPEEQTTRRMQMFGDAQWPEEVETYLKEHPGARIMALSMLSNLQTRLGAFLHLLIEGERQFDKDHQKKLAEEFRQGFNKIKFVVDEHLRTKPNEAEARLLEEIAIRCEDGDDKEEGKDPEAAQRLRWLMDPRR